MAGLNTPLDIFKLLAKTNCRECGAASCMAFAAAVIRQEKKLSDCPSLEKGVAGQYEGRIEKQVNLESIQQEQLRELQKAVGRTDLASRESLLGGRMKGPSLAVSCLGKEFEVRPDGTVRSQCHTHAWFSIPLLDYIVHAQGAKPAGRWLPLRELESGAVWARLFEQRCEKPLKRIADSHPGLFEDLIGLFSAARAPRSFNSDVAVMLRPLPVVPVLICYWKAEDGMDSKVHLFFDETAPKNLSPDSLFTMATGMVMMFEKIMAKHG